MTEGVSLFSPQVIPPTQSNVDQASQFFEINQFYGMNVLAPRMALADGEFAYLENLIPIASTNQMLVGAQQAISSVLTVVPPQGINLAALPAGSVVDRMRHFAVGPGGGVSATNWLIVHVQQGALYAYNLDTQPVAAPVKISGTLLFNQPDMAVWQGTQLLLADANAGYVSITLTGTSNNLTWSPPVVQTAPAANLSLIAVAFGRVWVLANTQTYLGSAPGSFTDFSAVNGGVSNVIANDSVRRAITRLQLSGDYLYAIGDGAVFAIYNVQASGAHQLTEVINTRGTSFYGAVGSIDKQLVFASSDNVYALQGFYPVTLMPSLAPFWRSLDLLTQPLVLGIATILGVQVLLVLARYNDPAAGPRSIFLALCKGNAFLLSQASNITYICTAEFTDPDEGFNWFFAYGTDGTNIFRLFEHATSVLGFSSAPGVNWKAVTKLYDMGVPHTAKNHSRSGAVCFCTSPLGTLQCQTDTESGSSAVQTQFLPQQIQFVNAQGEIISFTSSLGPSPGPILWTVQGIVMPQWSAQVTGRYVGFTVSGNTPGFSLAALATEFQPSGPWLGGGSG